MEDSKYACTDLQEHVRRLHQGLENGSLLVGSRVRDAVGLGTKHLSLAKKNKNGCRLHTLCQRGGIGREVTVERVVGCEFILSQLTREP